MSAQPDRPRENFIRIPHPRRRDRILARFDAARDVIEIKPAGEEPIRVDLTQFRAPLDESEAPR